jgi:hypothetical protein
VATVVAPRSLDEIRDLHAGASFPGEALADSETALVLFAAAWHGRQDAYWVAQAGLRATCVDLDRGRLEEMRAMYPDDWDFVQDDVYAFGIESDVNERRWDVVSLDPFTNQFDRCAQMLPTWCKLASNVVILGMDDRQLEVPEGWRITDRRKRSDYNGGVYWVVLERASVSVTGDVGA